MLLRPEIRIHGNLEGLAMKQILGIALVTLVVIGLSPYARSLGSLSPPPGVSSKDWVPFGDAAGFVVAHDNSLPTAFNSANGTLKGYFMVRRNDRWLRVDVAPDYGVYKAAVQR
jgi:hypothetical protein